MNETIKILQTHRTYRDFDPNYRLPENELAQIIQSARQAASWMNGQHYSIVNISDIALRQTIHDLLPLQKQIKNASVFLIFFADLSRMKIASEAFQKDFSASHCIDTLVTATSDCAFAAQNTVVAAESLGYGTCYIGYIRDIAQEIIELTHAPHHTFPLFGLCIGKPTVEMQIKPRLPENTIYSHNQYPQVNHQDLADYEQTMIEFARTRETLPWREKFANYYSRDDASQTNELWINQGWCQ